MMIMKASKDPGVCSHKQPRAQSPEVCGPPTQGLGVISNHLQQRTHSRPILNPGPDVTVELMCDGPGLYNECLQDQSQSRSELKATVDSTHRSTEKPRPGGLESPGPRVTPLCKF